MKFIIIMALSYTIGALPIEWILEKKRGWTEISAQAHLSVRTGMVWGGFEMVKGGVAALIGLILAGWLGACTAAVFVVIGHTYSVFTGFRGERGLAVAAGAVLILSPLLILCGLVIYFLSLITTQYRSLATYITIGSVMVLALFFPMHFYALFVVATIGLFLLLRYRSWWERFRKGAEPPVRWSGPFK
ncbi:glycerol-3-phosphate acyltransferase [Mechercharimyces sp. CAU 1602]|uniref:glycerol-3-phosphate acyltransferase n=1 Tax=Mechercharimyces sp. CAU 1602 TaxID=2973933 RepID=UPI0021623BE8|nr:glycerol-3-phosphate acyltransferase [Mechercharimyces sp. CAU 1602]MCS1351984.1 glycerol-3-phosphate acyltransferase [Mechercharimyces sp. CAU 1602]